MARINRLAAEEIQARLPQLPEWTVENGFLTRTFRFKAFMDGIAFVNAVAAVAEAMDHHPDIAIRFGLVTIALVTHGARGLTHLDFEQAGRIDQLFTTMAAG